MDYADGLGTIGNTEGVIARLADRFYAELVSAADQRLLDLAFAPEPRQSDLDALLAGLDIEALDGRAAMLLAYVMKANPGLRFSDYERPRLAGLLNFWRFSNLKLIAHFSKIARGLNNAGIVPMILKGGAMRHLRPDLPRAMGDIDILVREPEFAAALDIARGLGYCLDESSIHSVDLHTPGSREGTVDIHRWLDFETDYDKNFIAEIFARAARARVFGAEARVPAAEDMAFIALLNLAKNLHNNTSTAGILFTLFDLKWLSGAESKPDFDWSLVAADAVRTNAQVPLFFAASFVERAAPGLLPGSLLRDKALGKAAARYCNAVMFHRFYVSDVKMRCKKLKLKDAARSPAAAKNWLKDKPKHRILKAIGKSPLAVSAFLKAARLFRQEGKKCA